MPIPLLEYAPSSQNQRVTGFEVPGDEQPRIFTTDNLPSTTEMDTLILAAYRQIFHEQQMLLSNRQIFLESQLKAGQITVKDFIQGLVLSDSFRRLNYDVNNNYRFVELCVERVLGRKTYGDREKISLSIVLATKGIKGFVEELLNSEEYLSNFGDNTVPYQRRRVLPQRTKGELPFERTARYGTDYRDKVLAASREAQKFNLRNFLRSSNKDVVLWIAATTVVLVASAYLLPALKVLPPISPY